MLQLLTQISSKITHVMVEENGNIRALVLMLEVTISKEAMFDKFYLVHTVFYLISPETF